MSLFKKFFILLSLMIQLSAFALNDFNQHITCFPSDIGSSERVIISLENKEHGTLYITSGLNDSGDQDSIGPLPLLFQREVSGTTLWQAIDEDGGHFQLGISKNDLFQSKDHISISIDLKRKNYNNNDDLDCYSRLYPKLN